MEAYISRSLRMRNKERTMKVVLRIIWTLFGAYCGAAPGGLLGFFVPYFLGLELASVWWGFAILTWLIFVTVPAGILIGAFLGGRSFYRTALLAEQSQRSDDA